VLCASSTSRVTAPARKGTDSPLTHHKPDQARGSQRISATHAFKSRLTAASVPWTGCGHTQGRRTTRMETWEEWSASHTHIHTHTQRTHTRKSCQASMATRTPHARHVAAQRRMRARPGGRSCVSQQHAERHSCEHCACRPTCCSRPATQRCVRGTCMTLTPAARTHARTLARTHARTHAHRCSCHSITATRGGHAKGMTMRIKEGSEGSARAGNSHTHRHTPHERTRTTQLLGASGQCADTVR
jgi:hypothetical protein